MLNPKMTKEELRKRLKPFGSVIQVCPRCGKIDVVLGHEEDCNPVEESLKRMEWDFED